MKSTTSTAAAQTEEKRITPPIVCKVKQPRFHIAKRMDISFSQLILIHALALLAALACGGLLIFALGHNPIEVYCEMVRGSFGSATARSETVKMAVPLLITGIGIALAFRMKFWNIGGEGQILIGGIAATAVLAYMPGLPYLAKMLLMALAGILAGGIYGAVPAWFKTRWGTNETLFTLMLNYIALQLVRYLMYQPRWQDPGTKFPKIFSFGAENVLPKVLGVHIGWIFALILAVLSSLYLSRTKQGYEISVVGDSSNTARYAGMNVRLVVIRTIFLSGALCGLAGFFTVAGADATLTESTAGGTGFTAITVAWLAKLNPLVMILIALFVALLQKGSISIQSSFLIPASAADLLIGLILFFMLGAEFFCSYRVMRSSRSSQSSGIKAPSADHSAGASSVNPAEKEV